MAGYDVFARYYDALTANVDYKGRAAYLKKLLEYLHHEPGIVLDLACGTGSLTLELYKLGMDVYGVDGSISGISIDGSTQTTGIGSKVSDDSFASGFVGWNGGEVSSGSPVDGIAGATYSSNGAFNAINAAIDCYNNEIKGVQ